MIRFLAIIGLVATSPTLGAQSDTNGVPFDLQGFIRQEMAAGRKRIVVPPGRYRVAPENQQHLVLDGLNDVQVIADGVEMICTETTRALTLSRCTNVSVRGLVIDYDPLPFTQGRITSLAADKKVHEIELFDGYPSAQSARNFKYEIFRPDNRTLRCDDRSLDADAFHSKHASKGPSYLRCTARFMGDDCVNICGDYHMVISSQGRKLRVLAKHAMNVHPDDPVELVTYDGRRLPDARAVSVRPAGIIRHEERAFLLKQRMNESLRTADGALNKAFTITLDREVNLPMGSVICAANRVGSGFAVKDCTFGYNRSRGILIKASQGVVTGNRLEGCAMSAILVAPEYWWLEAGSSSGLKITGNTITACRGIPICIEAIAGNGDVAPPGAHHDLTISGNVVKGCAEPGILVCSTTNLRLANNTLDLQSTRKSIPDLMRKAGLTQLKAVVEINCER